MAYFPKKQIELIARKEAHKGEVFHDELRTHFPVGFLEPVVLPPLSSKQMLPIVSSEERKRKTQKTAQYKIEKQSGRKKPVLEFIDTAQARKKNRTFSMGLDAARERVARGLAGDPDHVLQFGDWMLTFASQLKGKDPVSIARDIVKAYLITRASIRRSSVSEIALENWGSGDILAANECDKDWKHLRWGEAAPYPEPQRGKTKALPAMDTIRAEDFMARALCSPWGQRYLDAAQDGFFDPLSALSIAWFFHPFGDSGLQVDMSPDSPTYKQIVSFLETSKGNSAGFLADLQYAPILADSSYIIIDTLQHGSKEAWRELILEQIYGLGPAKAGFLAMLLGRGDMATLDAREIGLWINALDKKFESASGAARLGGPARERWGLAHLEDRLKRLQIQLPTRLKPYYLSLVHWIVFEAVEGERADHVEIMKAMSLAGLSGDRSPDHKFLPFWRRDGEANSPLSSWV